MRRTLPLLPACLVGLLLYPGLAPAGEPSPEAVLADLPFDGAGENRVIVDLAPPDSKRPLRLFLDTGAFYSALTPLMARELGVRVRRTKNSPYRRPTLLGRDLQFWIDTRSSDTGSKTGWEYGLLGGTFLAEYVLEIDFRAERVRFLDRKEYRVPERVDAPGEAVLPLRIVRNRPHVEIEVEGKPVRVLLDTGAPYPAVLSGKAAKKLGLDWEPIVEIAGGSVLGPLDLELTEVGSLRLGTFGFGAAVPLLIAPRGWHNLVGSSDSVIGYDLLSQFVVRIDYARRRLWLRREGTPPLTLFGSDYVLARRSGVLLARRDGRYYTRLVFPGSHAERLGLRAGDAFARVDGFDGTLHAGAIYRTVAAGAGVTVLRMVDEVIEDVELPALSVAEARRPGSGSAD